MWKFLIFKLLVVVSLSHFVFKLKIKNYKFPLYFINNCSLSVYRMMLEKFCNPEVNFGVKDCSKNNHNEEILSDSYYLRITDITVFKVVCITNFKNKTQNLNYRFKILVLFLYL